MHRYFMPGAALIAVTLLAACAADPYATPPPAPLERTAEPADGRYTVTYRGAPDATPTKVRELALLRAATVTLQKGGDWFEIMTEYSRLQKESKSSFEQDPFGERTATRAECGVLGCPSNARPSVGQSDVDPATRTRTTPIQSFEIVVHSGERPRGRENTYDAVELSNELRARYSSRRDDKE